MEIIEYKVITVQKQDYKINIKEPTENLISLLNNEIVIEYFEYCVEWMNSMLIYNSLDIEKIIESKINLYNQWLKKEYWINREKLLYRNIKTLWQYKYIVDQWFEPVSENEYNEFIKMVSYEFAISEMSKWISNTDLIEKWIISFINYYIMNNSKDVLMLTGNWKYSTSGIYSEIIKHEDNMWALRKRTTKWIDYLLSKWQTWN